MTGGLFYGWVVVGGAFLGLALAAGFNVLALGFLALARPPLRQAQAV